MNQALEQFASEIGLAESDQVRLRLAFGYACISRIEHLLEETEVTNCLRVLGEYVNGTVDEASFQQAQKDAERLANQHRGSKSIDGCGHAAVSASYAVANAINGKALQAASYAAYATVYATGGYGAVAQPEAFEPEFRWQLNTLRELASQTHAHA
jgi:hypothetical protein